MHLGFLVAAFGRHHWVDFVKIGTEEIEGFSESGSL
jgi:hypothetical protein